MKSKSAQPDPYLGDYMKADTQQHTPTPGPWWVERDERTETYEITADARHGKVPIAEVSFGYREPFETEQRANVRLLAAAPCLLAALKAVVSVADRKTVEFDLARAAIRKAEARATPVSETPTEESR